MNNTRTLAVALFLTALAIASPARAQSGETAVAAVNTSVFIAPDATKTPLRVASAGTTFVVLEEAGEWTKVQFQDPQWGRRVGYVITKDLRVHRAALAPMDLSVKPETATPALPVETAPLATPPPPSPSPARSTSSSGPHGFERGWIDVNFGVAVAASKTFTTTVTTPLFRETRTEQASYRNPTGAEFDFGGGYMITPGVGVGISFTGTAHQDEAQLYINVPHPTRFDAFASSTKPTDAKLQRVEGGVNLQLMVVAPVSPRTKVRLFLGPTYFRVQQDMVGSIAYDQAFLVLLPVNAVDITTYERHDKVEGTGWGFHVGGDVSYYFTRVVGIGGFARFSRATVSLDDPLSGLPVDVKAGGFQAGGGLRLKF